MKILIISNLYPPYYISGYEIACEETASFLSNMGNNEVLILTSNFGVREGDFSKGKPDKMVYRVLEQSYGSPEKLSNLHFSFFNKKNYTFASDLIKEANPDIVYIWNTFGIGTYSIFKSVYNSRVPFIVHLMDYSLLGFGVSKYLLCVGMERSLFGYFIKCLVKISKYLTCKIFTPVYLRNAWFIAMSETVKNKFVNEGFNSERIKVIYHGLNDSWFSLEHKERLQEQNGNLKILYTGQINPDKGINVLIKAIKRITIEKYFLKIKVCIIGRGDNEYIDKLLKIIKYEKLENSISILPKLPREELMKIYSGYDIFVYPTLRVEPFGFSIIEAMSSGLAVIASDIGGPAEIIKNRETGFLFEPGNSKQLSDILFEIHNNPELRKICIKNAMSMVRKRYNLKNNLLRLEEFLQERA